MADGMVEYTWHCFHNVDCAIDDNINGNGNDDDDDDDRTLKDDYSCTVIESSEEFHG